ncbi:MAG: tetratricopeptide repeat protein, partial [Pirellulaceae bacterium]|nr:tetratricopeptide repeat protein [Pirellulaceae bacterium]
MKTTEFAAMYETPFGSRHRYLFALLVSVFLFSSAFAQAPGEKEEEVDPATKDLVAANRFYSSGRFKFAAQKYEGFLQRYPKHKEVTAARYGLAICQWKLQKFDEASKSIVQVLADSKFDRPDEALVVLGHCYMSTNQRDKALTTFVQLRTEHPKSQHTPTAALNEIQVLYLLDRKKESAAASQQFLKSYAAHGNAAAALYFLALSSHDLNDPAATGDAAKKLLEEHPNSRYQLDATLLLGQSLEAQGKYKDATAQYRELLRLAPLARQPEALYSLGVVLYRSAEYKESDKVLSELLSKHKQSKYAAPALMQLGLTQLANGDTSKARTTLSGVSKNDEQRRTTASYWLSQCDIAEKRFDTALKTLSVLAKLNP